MKAPSKMKLLETFRDLTPEDAVMIRKIAHVASDGADLRELLEKNAENLPETTKYIRKLFSSPWNSEIWRITVAMHAIDEVMDGFGVEGIGPPRSGDYAPPFEYINQGDTYATTLIYDRDKDRLFIGTWGAVVEAKEREWENQGPWWDEIVRD